MIYDNSPKISVITPSLNHGRFLRDTIESILIQSYKNFEHIIVDGGSTDDTINILNQYPHIQWISEKDESILEAYRKAIAISKGEYIIQCCVSDGFLNKDWFKKCVEILEADDEISLVWGFPQYMTEDGYLGKISYPEFFDDPPPQKMDFLPFWLATGFWFPEGNYCIRREVFDICFPKTDSAEIADRANPALPFNYNFNTRGYLSYFLPIIANFGRTHKDQRGQRLWNEIEKSLLAQYIESVKTYRKQFLKGKVQHIFRDGCSDIVKEIAPTGVSYYKRKIMKYRISRSRLVRIDLYTLYKKLLRKGKRFFGKM